MPKLKKPTVELNISIHQLAKRFGLHSTYETLEGHRRLNRADLLSLLEYSALLGTDQGGCRLLQKYISESTSKQKSDPELFNHIFDSSMVRCFDLMNDSFGNYLIQKLVENCSDEQLSTVILHGIGTNPLKVCFDAHGTRSIQKVIEVIRKPEQFE